MNDIIDLLTLGPVWRRIAKPYVKAERAACARICDSLAWSNPNAKYLGPENNCIQCAVEIQKRV